jgi:hypothetical protein
MRRGGRKYRLQVVLTSRGMGSVAAAFALCGYLATPSGTPDRARIVWNMTASAPVGLYVGAGKCVASGLVWKCYPANRKRHAMMQEFRLIQHSLRARRRVTRFDSIVRSNKKTP